MNLKTLLIAGVTGAVVGMTVAGCQTYDFEPVEPLAIAQTTERKVVISKKKKPNIMLLVDKSGSMKFAVDDQDPKCSDNCNDTGYPACPADCPLRLQDMKSAMQDFLGQYGTTARFGLWVFPEALQGDSCRTGGQVQNITVSNDVDSELQSAAAEINDTIQKLDNGGRPVSGGTPTATTLNLLANNSMLLDPERDNFVLLLTDGLPNCNNNLKVTTCVCVNGKVPCDDPRNCLDQDAVVQAISGLSSQDIRTIVVGFGADTGDSLARPTLNTMAQAGGFARSCQTNVDCGVNDTCDLATKTCGNKFYKAANASELAEALTRIQNLIGNENPCEFLLDAVPQDDDPRFLAVYVDEQRLTAGPDTWSYANNGTPTVTFSGDTCNRLTNASANAPVEVEIRIVEGL
ncbi:MAG: adventurous gliding motility lipoprotein CglB [Myxococcaceae bacterium]